MICFRSFTLRSPSRSLVFAFSYSFRVSSMHATRPDNHLYGFVLPGNTWRRADKRETARCLCIFLSLPDFHVRYISLIILSDTRHEVLPTTCGQCRYKLQESLSFSTKKSLSWYVCCLQATFFRRITHRLGVLGSGNNYTNTLTIQATQTQHKLYMIVFCFLLHVSIVHIDHRRVEKYRYRRKVLRIFLFCSAFPPVSVFHLMTVNMYNRNTQWKRKNECIEFVCCVSVGCIVSDLVTQRDDDMMMSKYVQVTHFCLYI